MSVDREINVTIDSFPEGEKSFVEIPFEVGADIERIEIAYHFPFGGGGSVIDLGVAQNGRMRGWSGSERGFITLEEDRATPGYDCGPLPGSWHAVLGIVKIGPACKVDLKIRLINKRQRWLVGELHSHSEHSDGGVTVLDAIHRARAGGLDFLAITDHNTISQNTIRPDDPGILVIPAMELTSFWGHTNFLGLAKPVADWRCRGPHEVVDRMAATPEKGDYGRLSVMLQWRYDVEPLFDVPPESFDPPPKVMSAIVRMTPWPQPAAVDLPTLEALVQVAFSQRRKLLRHTLGRWLEERGFSGHFDVQRRAEEVPVAEYVALAQSL